MYYVLSSSLLSPLPNYQPTTIIIMKLPPGECSDWAKHLKLAAGSALSTIGKSSFGEIINLAHNHPSSSSSLHVTIKMIIYNVSWAAWTST